VTQWRGVSLRLDLDRHSGTIRSSTTAAPTLCLAWHRPTLRRVELSSHVPCTQNTEASRNDPAELMSEHGVSRRACDMIAQGCRLSGYPGDKRCSIQYPNGVSERRRRTLRNPFRVEIVWCGRYPKVPLRGNLGLS